MRGREMSPKPERENTRPHPVLPCEGQRKECKPQALREKRPSRLPNDALLPSSAVAIGTLAFLDLEYRTGPSSASILRGENVKCQRRKIL